MASNLQEGMRPNDLEDLVLPLITIDEYESKLDDDAIVIGFYVGDRDAAQDLNRFIQKSPTQLLDTEISPAPDQHGFYIVFIELLNDKLIVENIESIINEISPLAGTDEWQMRLYGAGGVAPFDSKVLAKRFSQMRKKAIDAPDKKSQVTPQPNDGKNAVIEFFVPSDLNDAVMDGNLLTLSGNNGKFSGEVVAFGPEANLVGQHGLNESAVSMELTDVAESLKLTRLLGDNWLTARAGALSLFQQAGSDQVLILRNAKFA